MIQTMIQENVNTKDSLHDIKLTRFREFLVFRLQF